MELGLTSRIKFSLELSYAALSIPVGAILKPAKTSFLVPAKTSIVPLGSSGQGIVPRIIMWLPSLRTSPSLNTRREKSRAPRAPIYDSDVDPRQFHKTAGSSASTVFVSVHEHPGNVSCRVQ